MLYTENTTGVINWIRETNVSSCMKAMHRLKCVARRFQQDPEGVGAQVTKQTFAGLHCQNRTDKKYCCMIEPSTLAQSVA